MPEEIEPSPTSPGEATHNEGETAVARFSHDGTALGDSPAVTNGTESEDAAAPLPIRQARRRILVSEPLSTPAASTANVADTTQATAPSDAVDTEAESGSPVAIAAPPDAPDPVATDGVDDVDVDAPPDTLVVSPDQVEEQEDGSESPEVEARSDVGASTTAASDTPEVQPVAEKKRKQPIFPRPVRVVWSHRGVWLGLAAIIASAYGQAALFQEDRRPQAWWLLGGAMALAAIAWSGIPDIRLLAPVPGPRRRFLQLVRWRRGLALRLAGIGLSIALFWGSLQAWYNKPDEIFGLQGYLWLASMGMLLLSCARWYPTGKEVQRLEPRWTRREFLVLAFILLVAMVTRLAWLEEFPWRIDPNEWLAWNESIKFMQNPPTMSVFTTTWLDTGLPSMYFWFEAIPMRLFGDGLAWIRFLTALLGALFVIPTYLLARLLWGRIAGVIAATLVVGSSTLIQHTRMTNNNISTTIFWTFCFYFLLRGLRSRRPNDFVWAGLFAGTSMYTYYGTRLIPYLLLAYLGFMVMFHFRASRERIGHYALVALGLLIGFGPLLAYFTRHPDKWAGRGIYEMVVPPTIPTTWDAIVSDWNVISQQLVQNFLSLSVLPARDTFYWAPFLRPLESILLVVGGGVLIWRWRQPASFLILLWGLSIMLVASLIDIPINPNPNFPHWSPAWTVAFLLLTLPLTLWLQSLRRLKWRRWWWAGCVIVGVFVSWIAFTNIHFTYITYPKMVPTDNSGRAIQARFLAQVKPNTIVRYIGCCSFDYEYGRAFARQTSVGQLMNASRQLPLLGDATHDHIFYIPGWPNPYVPILQYYYPGGRTQNLEGPDGRYGATIYSVDAAQLMSSYGVQVTVTDLAEKTTLATGQVPNVGALPLGLAAYTYPVVATWSGEFYVRITASAFTANSVQLRVEGGADAQGWVMGQPDALNKPLKMDAGWVPFVVKARLTGPAPLRLLKTEADGIESELTTSYLWPDPPNMGLMVTLAGDTATRVDQFVGSTAIRPDPNYFQPGKLPLNEAAQLFQPLSLTPQFADGKALGRWAGELYAEGGTYLMELAVDGSVQLLIDDTLVINNCSPFPGGIALNGGVNLTPGWHKVELRLDTIGPGGGLVPRGLEWMWTRPDGVREVVPPTRLRYSPTTMPETGPTWPSPAAPVTCSP